MLLMRKEGVATVGSVQHHVKLILYPGFLRQKKAPSLHRHQQCCKTKLGYTDTVTC